MQQSTDQIEAPSGTWSHSDALTSTVSPSASQTRSQAPSLQSLKSQRRIPSCSRSPSDAATSSMPPGFHLHPDHKHQCRLRNRRQAKVRQSASQPRAQVNRSSVGISIEAASPASSVQLWKGKSMTASRNFASRTSDANRSLLRIRQFSSFLHTSSGELFCKR